MNSRKIINRLNENIINDKITMTCDGFRNITGYDNPKGKAYKTVRRILGQLVKIKLLVTSKNKIIGFFSYEKKEIDEYDIAATLNSNILNFKIDKASLELLNDILELEIREETVCLGDGISHSLFVVNDRSPFGLY